ncbi:MAG: T9SS type A sorting domain-containing protein [Bacteroidetes bacterium]|nr:T9SS type A sorting domain-containing protein [Bacteroidota bacterium]
MKKQLFITFLSFLFAFQLIAQTTPATLQWERSQNGVIGRNNYFVKTKIDINGNTYALANSDEDMLVVKFNSNAQVVQTYIYNNSSNAPDYAADLEVDALGNVYISGSAFINYMYWATIVKFDSQGNQLWVINYLPSNSWIYPTSVSANAIALDASGNVFFTGSVNDSLIAGKISSAGTIAWVTTANVNGSNIGSGKDIAIDQFGSVYITGSYKNSLLNNDAVTVKFNSNGAQQWFKTISGFNNEADEAINIGIDNSSNVYVASNIADSTLGAFNNYSVYLTKYNASGAQQWQKKFHESPQVHSSAVKLHVDNIGNTYLGRNIMSSAGFGYSVINKYNSTGTLLQIYTIDDPLYDRNILTDIYVDQNANIYAAGNIDLTAKLFYAKYGPLGHTLFYNEYDHNGFPNIYSIAGIVAEPNGFFNVIANINDLFMFRINNAGVYQYEGIYSGEGNGGDVAVKTIAQGSNSVYALGELTNANTYIDAVLSKYDTQGNILWQNTFDNNAGYDNAYDMGKDSVFNIYLLKAKSGGSEIIKHDSIGSPAWTSPTVGLYRKMIVANGGNAYLAGQGELFGNLYKVFKVGKLDNLGNFVYESSIVQEADDSLNIGSMVVDDNERIIAAGHRNYAAGQPGQKTRIIVDKFTNTGALQWHRELPMSDSTSTEAFYYSNVSKVLVDDLFNTYVFGTLGTPTISGHAQAFLAKISDNGTIVYIVYYDGSSTWFETSGDMRFNSNGDIIMYSASTSYHVIRKIDPSNGAIIWENDVAIGIPAGAKVVRLDGSNDIYFTGQSVFTTNGREIVLGKISNNGVLRWITTKAGATLGNSYAESMDVTNNGRIYIAASMSNRNGTASDFSLLKFCDIAQPTLSTADQTQNICPGDNVTLVAPNSNSYLWSNGTTTNDSLVASATGSYYCALYKSDGCYKNSDTINVLVKPVPSTPQICAVTVDSLSTHNIIFWDKSSIVGASAFNIYREDLTNVYSYIGTVVYDSLSEFHDYGANPNTTTKRYKITAVDTCGQESPMSNYHNTLYIVSNGTGQFSWNPIYTIENNPNPVNNYLLMRDDAGTGNWTQVASTAGTQFIINDVNYASYPTGRWRVETAWNISCLATRGAINTTRSNIKTPTSVGINELSNQNSFAITPNPANESVTISVDSREENMKIEIYNTLGQKVIEQKLENTETQILISELQAGTYFVKLNGKQNQTTKKLIKY